MSYLVLIGILIPLVLALIAFPLALFFDKASLLNAAVVSGVTALTSSAAPLTTAYLAASGCDDRKHDCGSLAIGGAGAIMISIAIFMSTVIGTPVSASVLGAYGAIYLLIALLAPPP